MEFPPARQDSPIAGPATTLMDSAKQDFQVLQALCQTEDASTRRRACEILQKRQWKEPEHQVIFEACARLTDFGVRISSAALAAQLTRAGFPDVDLDALFEPLPHAAAELLRRLEGREEGAR